MQWLVREYVLRDFAIMQDQYFISVAFFKIYLYIPLST